MFGLRKLGDVVGSVRQSDQLAALRQRDWIIKFARPGHENPFQQRLLIPIEVRPEVSAVMAAGLANEPGLEIGYQSKTLPMYDHQLPALLRG